MLKLEPPEKLDFSKPQEWPIGNSVSSGSDALGKYAPKVKFFS